MSLIRTSKCSTVLTRKSIYYQGNLKRLSVCTLPIHTLLHLADCIEGWGPVWCYWSYPMERFCGHLKRGGAASKRFPYKSLDRYVFDWSIMWHLGAIYDLRDLLKLNRKQGTRKCGRKSDDILECESKDPAVCPFTYTAIQIMGAPLFHDGRCHCLPLQKYSCSSWEPSQGIYFNSD